VRFSRNINYHKDKEGITEKKEKKERGRKKKE